MKYFSLFAGIGTGEKGIEQAFDDKVIPKTQREQQRRDSETRQRTDIKRKRKARTEPVCCGISEIDRFASAIHQHNFGVKNYGDATKLIRPDGTTDIPDFDLLIGGPPCQSWSIAGKRGGFEDFRGTMWYECFKVLKAKRPKFFLFENVAGLLSHDSGKSMERICEEFCECGYAIDFELLNSKNFGVPQSRNRVWIIGIRLDLLDESQIF